MPDAETVSALGSLPLPALVILAIVVAVVASVFIFVKFGEGRKAEKGPQADLEVKLATFDPRLIQALVSEMARLAERVDHNSEMLQLNTREAGVLSGEVRTLMLELVRRSAARG